MKTLGWVGKRNDIFHVYCYLLVFPYLSGREGFPTFSTFFGRALPADFFLFLLLFIPSYLFFWGDV